MTVKPAYFLLRGGLDLVTPAMAVPDGFAIAAMNYASEASGYRRLGGYERFDGRPSPSLGANAEIAAERRLAIGPVPGVGPVRGVVGYQGDVYAFRDSVDGQGKMYRSTPSGWMLRAFGYTLAFKNGTTEPSEGATLQGANSGAFATIDRVVLQSGAWDGTAQGYMVISDVTGAFGTEAATDTMGGAVAVSSQLPIGLSAGGRYDIVKHNFYGAARRRRLYFTSGVDTAHEFDGKALVPIRTGTSAGALEASVTAILTRAGNQIVTRGGDRLAKRSSFDIPTHLGVHSNHLFLAYSAGSIIHSGIGEPADYRPIAGAGEFSFGGEPTCILSAVSTTLVVFGQSRVEYVVGTDGDTFEMKPITAEAGASRWSVQVAGEAPLYLDEGGLRKLNTTEAFGDWSLGTISALIEPLIRAKREAGILVTASQTVKAKDQYRLFFDDGSGLVVYLGRKNPEIMPIRLPAAVFCSYSGELAEGLGERLFVGSEDGFVYEMERGSSFDGQAVPAYLRLAWNALRAANIEKRFHSARFETDSKSPLSIGFTYHVDYNATDNLAGEMRSYAVPIGTPSVMPAGADYDSIDWTQATAGELYVDDLSALGRNIALTLITEHTAEEPHTFTAMTLNYSPRRQLR